MTVMQFKPYNNRVVNYVTNQGFRGIGIFMDIINDKLTETEVMFIPEKNVDVFRKIVLANTGSYQSVASAVKTYGKRVFLEDINKMALVPKYELMDKWRASFSNEKFLRYLRLEDVPKLEYMRKVPTEYGGLKIMNGGGKYKICDEALNMYELTQDEYTGLEEMFDKAVILKK